MKGGEVFHEEHVWVLLGLRRASDHTIVTKSADSGASEMHVDEFDFVPEVPLAVLHSHHQDPSVLHRALRLDWVRTWKGWNDAADILDISDDPQLQTEICAEYVRRFLA